MLETKSFMNAHGGFVLAVADYGDELPAPSLLAAVDQFLEQGCADPAACMFVMHIHRIF